MGPGQKFLTRVRSFFVAQVGSGQPFLIWVWIWKISPKNVHFSIFFLFMSKKISLGRVKSTWVKGGSASYLLRVKSMLGLGRVRAHLYEIPPILE